MPAKKKHTFMNDPRSDSRPLAESWDTYWQGTRDGAASTSGGVSHPVILAFWDAFFKAIRTQFDSPRIIDIACGNGALVERAKTAFDGELPDITCLDVSAGAIGNLEQRFPGVHGIVADARSIPLESGHFDVATSQFGVEYAGLEAVDEAARLVAPGGQLALLLHHHAGRILKECAANLDAIEKMQEAKFIPYSIRMFEAGFAACRGADRADYDAAAEKLMPAIRTMESIMMQHGKHVADDMIIRLYNDVDRIHREIQHYEPPEVLGWLRRMEGELPAYAGRMASMCNAALDAEVFEELCDNLRGQAHKILRGEPLAIPDHDLPLAWVLVAAKE